MEATDLMIGDWVTCQKWKEKEKPFRITSITNSGRFAYCKTAYSTVEPFLIEELEPIPLTFEILELNGFHHEDFGCSLVTTDDKSFLLLGVFSGGTYLWHEAKIHYVHELQHALRLCGLNELANNLKMEE